VQEIAFFNQYTGYLFIDVVNAFADEGYTCILFAGEVLPGNIPLRETVSVKKLKKYDRSTNLKRLYTWLAFTWQGFWRILFLKRSTELFIVTNPPFMPFLGYFFCRLKGSKYHLLVYDVYPDALVQVGKAERKGFMNRIWSKWNSKMYRKAKTIYTLSDNMKGLIEAYEPNVKVEVVHNWADTSFIKPVAKQENMFAIAQGQTGKLTVMYSGNMGMTHAIEKIAKLAEAFIRNEEFGFMLIGDGAKKPMLEEMKNDKALNNLTILPYQATEMLPYSLTTADVAIVTLSVGAEELSVPSKTYNMLAAGAALLIIASKKSELATLVQQYDCGAVFEENNLDGMVAFLNEMKANPGRLAQLKANARKASQDFTPENAKLYVAKLNSNIGVS
jgi:glycosyltransferase involved in cell wall biosynthesis